MRFSGVHLMDGGYNAAFWKVQHEFQNPWAIAAYVIGIIAASWHFSYGVWLFAAKWGITVGDQARKRFGYVCLGAGDCADCDRADHDPRLCQPRRWFRVPVRHNRSRALRCNNSGGCGRSIYVA